MAATQVQSMTATEAAELAHEAATKAHQAIGSKVQFFAELRNSLEQDCARLQSSYDQACREAAKGNGTDPTPIAAELQAKRARLHGAELEYTEAVAKYEPLAKTATKAGLALSLRRHEDELADLLKQEIEAANAARVSLQKADEAKRAHNAVNYEIGQLRKKKEQTEAELREASNG
jgi:hypothetical protein